MTSEVVAEDGGFVNPAGRDQLLRTDPAVFGEFPGALGITTTELGDRHGCFELTVRPEFRSHFGIQHGGVVAALIDHSLGSVLLPHVEPGTWPATLEFKMNFLAPVREGVVRATATILARRRSVAVVRIDVENAGRAVAAAQGTVSFQSARGSSHSGVGGPGATP
ncbi:PaaI family thioesterase [Amycolatopsis samaneae]|uniref:Medium/long-chain acyl-CoA thioesterase YigI n=1 Tax=Amycolatopsis samaneae TaxID=664691 RepID=A0ABW5GM09_9PSEU